MFVTWSQMALCKYLNFPLSDRRFDSFFFTTMKHKEKFSSWITKTHQKRMYVCIYAYNYTRMCVYVYAYVRILIRVCAYVHTRMCVYSYAYVRIIRVCAVNVYLSGTVTVGPTVIIFLGIQFSLVNKFLATCASFGVEWTCSYDLRCVRF